MTGPMGVGVVGAGVISDKYLTSLTSFPDLRVLAVADLDTARAAAQAAKYGVPGAGAVAELLADPAIELVVNLTVPTAHVDVGLAALESGKHVWAEKPLAMDRQTGRKLLDRARERGLRVASAPDTVLGAALQTARRAIDAGVIGAPMSALALLQTPGPEDWHPSPEFLFQPGAGPLLDMGPYYLTALVTMLGPVVRVSGATSRMRAERVIGSGPRRGEVIPVQVDTHVTGVLEHQGGVLSTILMSFDAVGSRASRIEVHGDRASLAVPDPNLFDGDVALRRLDGSGWEILPVSAGYRSAGRGYGIADLAAARPGRPPRASARLAYHVLEVMERLLESARAGRRLTVQSAVERPEPVPLRELPKRAG